MRVKKLNKMQAKIKAPAALIKKICENPSNFRLTENEQCAFTYAKLYYRGGGWWLLSGHAVDGSDVQRVLQRLWALWEQANAPIDFVPLFRKATNLTELLDELYAKAEAAGE